MLLNNSLQARIENQRRALISAIVTTLILLVFQPFGTYEAQHEQKYLMLAGYGAVTFISVFVTGVVEIKMSEYKQHIRGYSLWVLIAYILTVAMFNHAYFSFAVLGQWHWQNQLLFVYYVTAIGLVVAAAVYYKSKSTKPDDKDCMDVTSDEELTAQDSQTNPVVFTIKGENKSDAVNCSEDSLLALKSADNYCEIYLADAESQSTTMIRSSLDKVIQQLPSHINVERCHRSWAVNIDLVEAHSGNANGLSLTVGKQSLSVPVSRRYVEAVKQALSVVPVS